MPSVQLPYIQKVIDTETLGAESPAAETSTPTGAGDPRAANAALKKRLGAALACSCLIHALVLFLPQLGATGHLTRPNRSDERHAPERLAATLKSAPLVAQEEKAQPAINTPPPTQKVSAPESVAADARSMAAATGSDNRLDSAGALPVPGTVYYPTDMLTTRPQPIGQADLDPPAIRPIIASGKVVLMLWISPLGVMTRVQVEASDMPPNFAAAATSAFQRMRFTPGELHGQPVGSIMKVEVRYDDGRIVSTAVVQ